MNERLKERIAEEWAQLDPVDPLRRLLSDVIDVLAQPAQEPDELTIAYMSGLYDGKKKRPWVGLTDDEMLDIERNTTCEADESWLRNVTCNIEDALRSKNT
jgi:hypothetical protein